MSKKHNLEGWWVLVDDVRQSRPRRVSRHATEAQARAEARRLNLAGPPGRTALYFVECWQTSDVLDVERSA